MPFTIRWKRNTQLFMIYYKFNILIIEKYFKV